MKSEVLPEYLIVAAAGDYEPGLAVKVQFGMRKKNNFSIIAFIQKNPISLSKASLLERFDQIKNSFLMDYADPRKAFNGQIEVKTLTATEIRLAIEHYHAHAKSLKYPTGYLLQLEAALYINPRSDCLVAFEPVY